ncbi:VOC family protein [Ursidibacter maritimus]|uniref:VOC family protein n=1 Tax=Ursidibacter maritimus TaxID=1331689 RepID=A0A949WIN4_9PAST|nr:VOC family protein [Ursidibacter maritimus]KAE9538999.1 glyoxalase [Ursidibacter maritimus]MBV6523738.1 VOC family protein [Ursidibacter maritimus]MBV6526017.1 VOC family protein [Ursidibacter maritimus]MBV6527932.1 VOC family protein [Ursidibacter maritimus]MBV6528871.1 VOC family protein [Ursidibacter maritimus]
MPNPVSWFEIHVDDLQRAKAFYEGVFQHPLTESDCPSGNESSICIFSTDYEEYGIGGMLYTDKNYPIIRGNNFTIFFNCDDCAVESARAEAFGGKLLQEKTSIGEEGFYAVVEDSEGNRIGLHSMQ